MTSKVDEALGYEQARDELIEVVRRLEAGGTTLEESLALWERGEELAKVSAALAGGRTGAPGRGPGRGGVREREAGPRIRLRLTNGADSTASGSTASGSMASGVRLHGVRLHGRLTGGTGSAYLSSSGFRLRVCEADHDAPVLVEL